MKYLLPFDWLCGHQQANIHVRGIQLANQRAGRNIKTMRYHGRRGGPANRAQRNPPLVLVEALESRGRILLLPKGGNENHRKFDPSGLRAPTLGDYRVRVDN